MNQGSVLPSIVKITYFRYNLYLASLLWLLGTYFFTHANPYDLPHYFVSEIVVIGVCEGICFFLLNILYQVKEGWAEKNNTLILSGCAFLSSLGCIYIASRLRGYEGAESASGLIALSLLYQSILNPSVSWRLTLPIGIILILFYVGSLIYLLADPFTYCLEIVILVCSHGLGTYAVYSYQQATAKEKKLIYALEWEKDMVVKAQRNAESANKAKDQFLANMSHELRTPLYGIIGLSERMLEQSESWKTNYSVSKIRKTGLHLLSLVNDILDYSKMDYIGVTIKPTEINFQIFVNDLFDLFDLTNKKNDLDVFFEISESVPLYLETDAKILKQILVNLIGNSIKFTETGFIHVAFDYLSTSVDSGSMYFQVTDTGVGISAENQSRLFKPFEQGDQSNTKKYSGTGLGLVLTKKLVEAMDGDIGFESENNSGSKFWVVLPVKVRAKLDFYSSIKNKLEGVTTYLIVSDDWRRDQVCKLISNFGCASMNVLQYERAISLSYPPSTLLIFDARSCNEEIEELFEKARGLESKYGVRFVVLLEQRVFQYLSDKFDVRQDRIVSYPILPKYYSLFFEKSRPSKSIDFRPMGKNQTDAIDSGVSGLKILIADDSLLNVEILLELLVSNGMLVDFAENGKLALDMIEDSVSFNEEFHRYDLFLIDMQMPVMDGIELINEIKRIDSYHATPIISITANVLERDIDLCYQSGASVVITKPILSSELLLSIARLGIVGVDLNLMDRIFRSNYSHQESTYNVKPSAKVGSTALQRIKKISAINLTLGIQRCNGKCSIYVKALRRFVDFSQPILDSAKENLLQMELAECVKNFHLLSGIISVVGAEEISEKIAAVSFAIANNHPNAEWYSAANELLEDVYFLRGQIESVFATSAESVFGGADRPIEVLKSLSFRDNLRLLLLSADPSALDYWDKNKSHIVGYISDSRSFERALHEYSFDVALSFFLPVTP